MSIEDPAITGHDGPCSDKCHKPMTPTEKAEKISELIHLIFNKYKDYKNGNPTGGLVALAVEEALYQVREEAIRECHKVVSCKQDSEAILDLIYSKKGSEG